jgi:hypothetical protein
MTEKEEQAYNNALSDLIQVSSKLNEYIKGDTFLSDLLNFSSEIDRLHLLSLKVPETQRNDRKKHIDMLRKVFTMSSRLWLEVQIYRVNESKLINDLSAANQSILELSKRCETLQEQLNFINEIG